MITPARWTAGVVAVVLVTAALWTFRCEPTTPVDGHARAQTVAESARADAPLETSTPEPQTVETPATVKVDEPGGDVALRFVVTTVGDDPRPIPRAEVDVRPPEGPSGKFVMGPDGTARLTAPIAAFEGCDARVSASGVVPIMTLLHVERSGDIRLTLDRDLALTGRVLDGQTGRPIEGALIEACQQKATTNAEGEFLVAAGTWSDKRAYGDVRAPGHVGLRFEHDARSGPLTLWLDPGGRVTGVVRTKDGSPVANAVVSGRGATHEETESPQSHSSAAGAFTLDGLAFGVPYKVSAWRNDLSIGETDAFVTTPDSPEVVRDVVLGVGESLTVVVLDAAGGVVPRAAVSVAWPPSKREYRATTDALGVAVVDAIQSGPYVVTVWSDSFAQTSTEVSVAPQELKRVEIRLPPGVPISGVVVDDEGAPVVGASVGFLTPRPFYRGGGCTPSRHDPFLSVQTTEDGSFHAVVPRRTGLEFELTAPGRLRSAASELPADDPLRLVAPRAAWFGFVLRPPAGMRWIRLVVKTYDTTDREFVVERMWDSRDGEIAPFNFNDQELPVEAPADRFRFLAPVTTRRVTIAAAGFLTATRDVRPVLGAEADLGEIALDRGVPLRGRIVGDDGVPVRCATVAVSRPSTQRTWEATGRADGTFELTGIPDGPVDMEISAPTHVRARRSVAAGARVDPLAVTLDRGVVVVVRVLDAAGAATPCDAIAVVAADGSPTVAALERTTSGRWAGRLPAGRWRLVASRGDAKIEQTIDVAAGAARVFTMRVER